MEFDSLGSGEEFDGDDLADVFGNGIEFAGGKRGHADVIFLVSAGGEAIDAGRMGIRFVFADQSGGGDVGNHESAIEPGVGREKRGEIAEGAIDEEGDSAFGKATDFGAGNGEAIGGEGDGFGVEVAAAQNISRFGEDEGVIGDAVGFDMKDSGLGVDLLEDGTHDLGLATQGVGVLNAVVVFEVARADFGALEKIAVELCNVDLFLMSADFMNAWIEGGVGALCGIDRKGPGEDCGGENLLGFEKTLEGDGGADLGAVEKCKTFFGVKLQGLDTGFFQSDGSGFDLVLVEDFAFAHQSERVVGEGGEVAGCTDGALTRDARENSGIVDRDGGFEGFGLDAAVALGKG